MKKIILIIAGLVSLIQPNISFSQTTYLVNGTFGCLSSPNFSGFVNRVTKGSGSSNGANTLLLITFTSGSPNVTMSGVNNNINNFEQINATNTAQFTNNATHFYYTPNTPVANMYLLTDTSSTPPFSTYFILVNSGKTLLSIDAPTVDKNNNMVCQAM
jgi:hypothetical protein